MDRLPPLLILFSILCHLVYLQNFTASWPFISLTSARFLMSCCLVVADHFLWFFYFAERAQSAKKYSRTPRYRYGAKKDQGDIPPTFMDVAAFFAVCVWLVPLFLFLSLSANDNALPSFGGWSCGTLNSVLRAHHIHHSPDPGGDPSMVGTPAAESRNPIDLSTPGLGSAQYSSYPTTSGSNHGSLVKSVLNPLLGLLPRIKRKRREAEGLIAPRTPNRATPMASPIALAPGYSPWNGPDESASMSGATSAFADRVSGRHGNGLLTPPPPRRATTDTNLSPNKRQQAGPPSPLGHSPSRTSLSDDRPISRPGTPNGSSSSTALGVSLNGGASQRRPMASSGVDVVEAGRRKLD